MSQPTIFSIIESAAHPQASSYYRQHGYQELKFTGMRRALSKLKTVQPDFVVAEFFYGWGNNYAGVNVSNLDTLLSSLQRYAPDAKVIVLVSKKEHEFVAKLEKLFPLHAVLVHPVTPEMIGEALQS